MSRHKKTPRRRRVVFGSIDLFKEIRGEMDTCHFALKPIIIQKIENM